METTKFYEKISKFIEKYNKFINEEKKKGEYYDCTADAFIKYVFAWYDRLVSFYFDRIDSPMRFDFPKVIFHNRNIYAKELFEYLISLNIEFIEAGIEKMTIQDMFFKEEILSCIRDENYDEFKSIAKEHKTAFETFSNAFKLHFMRDLEEDDENVASEDKAVIYKKNKDDYFECLDSIIEVPDKSSYSYFFDFIKNAVIDAKSEYPSVSLFNNESINKWTYKHLYYCFFVVGFCGVISDEKLSEELFFYRILWHPCTIRYRYRWSSFILQLPFKDRIIKENFFDIRQSDNMEEYFTSIRTELLDVGVNALTQFVEICPLKDYFRGEQTFVYRITGRNRPDKETLSTDILFEDSAPYIYYFIKGITNPNMKEDVYGKMKAFFATTEFPDDEKDIPEPCDSWKEVLAEIYPTIFGGQTPQQKKLETGSIKLPFVNLSDFALSKIGEMYFNINCFDSYFKDIENAKQRIIWTGKVEMFAYIFRIIYVGIVKNDTIEFDGKMTKELWKKIANCFWWKEANKTLNLNTLKQATAKTYREKNKEYEKIDKFFMPHLRAAKREAVSIHKNYII